MASSPSSEAEAEEFSSSSSSSLACWSDVRLLLRDDEGPSPFGLGAALSDSGSCCIYLVNGLILWFSLWCFS